MKDVAITCYIDNEPNILAEFGWLAQSWLLSGSWMAADIVAFHHPAAPIAPLPQDPGITYIPLAPFSEATPGWADYPFINSVAFLTTREAGILARYEYVLRTDCDCFLTPHFPTLRPRLPAFGAGQYAGEPSVAIRLAGIAERWGIKPVFNNIGSSVMGRSNQVLVYAQIHLEYCRRLRDEEFQDGPGKWPGWWRGVLSMYAGQLAAQSYFGLAMTIGGLDVHCLAHEPISPQDYHIHAWHSFEHFSKFNWRQGKYRGYDMAKLDRNRIADYCLWIAGPGP